MNLFFDVFAYLILGVILLAVLAVFSISVVRVIQLPRSDFAVGFYFFSFVLGGVFAVSRIIYNRSFR